jgi:hypothetical protein
MPIPRCPVCGCEAVDLSEPDTRSAPQSMNKSGAEIVICHCLENHRFVVSLNERALAQAGFGSGASPLMGNRQ